MLEKTLNPEMISFLFRFTFIYLTYARATADTFPWTELTTSGTKPSKRYAHSSISYNGQMVIFGGIHDYYDHTSSSMLTDIFDDVWTLDLTSFAWSELTISGTKPSARFGHSSILYNGQIYGSG